MGKETRGDLELDGAAGEDPPSAEVEEATASQSVSSTPQAGYLACRDKEPLSRQAASGDSAATVDFGPSSFPEYLAS